MKNKKLNLLEEKWNPDASDAPSARSLEMVEITEDNYLYNPFPISLSGQKRLLELIYNRKSGIITRQELINVLFNPENIEPGTIIRCRI